MPRLGTLASAMMMMGFAIATWGNGTSWAADLVWAHPDQDGGATDDSTAIVDALTANGIVDITTVGELPSDLAGFDRVWVLLGTYTAMAVTNHEMTEEEGQILANYLTESNGHVYLSGSDHFFFDPPTPLDPLDGAEGTADGEDDVTTLAGLDSMNGLDLTGIEMPYTGETMFNDHIEPDLPGAALIWNDTVTGDPLGIYHDGSVSGLGSYRIICSSFEFGGYGDADGRNELMGLYLSALTGGGCPVSNPIAVTCQENAGNVDVNWSNDGNAFDVIEVIRNGDVIAALPGTAKNYTDMGIAPGAHTYQIRGADNTAMCAGLSEPCVIFFQITDLVWTHPDQDLGSNDDESAILAALEANGVEADSVDFLPDDLSVFSRVWVSLGTYFNATTATNHVMTAAEGQILADYLEGSGGRLYLSGADHFQFDPPTALAALDGVDYCGTPMVQTPCDGVAIGDPEGMDSGTGLDLSGLIGDYTGENMFIDLLPADPSNPGAGIIWENSNNGNPIGAFHDGNASGLGDFKVIATSFEFGGFADPSAQFALMALYLEAFDGGPPPEQFIRGDADGDGDFNGLVDMVFLLRAGLVPGAPSPPCFATMDVNGDGQFTAIADGIYGLNAQFAPNAPPPPAPFPDCGTDQESIDALGCDDPDPVCNP